MTFIRAIVSLAALATVVVAASSNKMLTTGSEQHKSDQERHDQTRSRFIEKYFTDVVQKKEPGHLRRLDPGVTKAKCRDPIPFYSDADIFFSETQTNAVGTTVDDIPIFSREDDSEIGLFTLVSIGLEDGTFEDGYLSIFDDQGDILGTVYYAGQTPVGGDFAITGGTGAYGCASGVLKFIGFENDQFKLDLILCGDLCDSL